MSPPEQPATPHEAQETSHADTPAAEVVGTKEAVSRDADATETTPPQPERTESHEGATEEIAGQAPEPHQSAGQQQDDNKDAVDESMSEKPTETPSKPLRLDTQVGSAASKQASQKAEPVEETTAKTADLDISSTPPPDAASKASGKAPVRSPSPPPPPPKDDKYLGSGQDVPSRTTSPVSAGKSSGRNSEDADAAEYAKFSGSGDAADDSKSEIQSIMEQFEHGSGAPGADEIMSPRMEFANPLLESPISHPPRASSLEPLNKPLPTPRGGEPAEQALQSPPPRTSSLYRAATNTSLNEKGSASTPMSPSAHAPQYKPTPPVPEPDPDLPFDFHRFLEQLRHRTADPVAKFLRSFLLEFGKKQWMVHEQVKIIGDFLEFISKKMAQCEVWRTVSDAEFDNAREGMEKLVMNRLYNQTFSPAIPPPEPVSQGNRRRRQQEVPGPGRRGQHQEDVERDEVLAQKVRIYKWVKEEHLDIKPVGDKGRKFLHLAQQELLKIKSYRAPRDKVICVLNCCKVIFGFLRTSQSDQSADAFVPLLIYTVLQANPDHLVSNVQYILRFRNQDKLGGEAGYYISSLMGAIQFIEGLDRTSLTVTDDEFEKNVEAAVSAIAEKHAEMESEATNPESSQPPRGALAQAGITPGHRRMPSPHLHVSEKSALSRAEVTPRNSVEAERAGPRRSISQRNGSREEPEEENAAVAGLLRTIQRPLSTIGRIFSDTDTHASSAQPQPLASGPVSTPQPGSTPRMSPGPRRSSDYARLPTSDPSQNEKGAHARRSGEEQRHRERLSAEDAAARQASAEAEEARRIQRQEHQVVVETLAGMFPGLDREIIDDVVRAKDGRVGLAVDACLALSNP